MSLPRSLNISLNRFDKSASELIKVLPHRNGVSAPDQIIYKFPSNGVIDLQSIALIASVTIARVAGAGTGNKVVRLGDMIRRLDILCNGTQIWGSGCSNFQDAYNLRRNLAEPKYLDTGSNRCFDMVDIDIAASNSKMFMLQDFPGLSSSNIRFLPLSAIGDLEVRIQLDSTRIPSTNTHTVLFNESYLLVRKVTFDDQLIDKMVAAQMQSGRPIEMVMENWATFQSPAYTGTGDFNISISTQSLDYLIVTSKDAVPASQEANSFYKCGGDSATVQIAVNGSPVSSFPLALWDAFYASVEALDGIGGNVLVDPKVTSYAEWRDQKYMYAHRFSLPAVDSDEAHRLVSGLNTYGSSVPITCSYRNAGATALIGHAVAIYRSTVEIAPGRVITVIN